jgi:hypothetical protein
MLPATSPPTESGIEISCGLCAGRIGPSAEASGLGDLYFHASCVPNCDECGQSLRPMLERDWSYEVMIVPSVYGYECVPFHHLCPDCQEQTLHMEPIAQD